MNRLLAGALAGPACLLALTACTSAGPTPAAAAPSVGRTQEAAPAPASAQTEGFPEPKNPVPILKKITGCVIPDSTVEGKTDINGNRYAECNLDAGTGHGITAIVRTYPGDPKVFNTQPMRSDDGHKVIVGADFTVDLWPTTTADSLAKVKTNDIAAQVGGRVT